VLSSFRSPAIGLAGIYSRFLDKTRKSKDDDNEWGKSGQEHKTDPSGPPLPHQLDCDPFPFQTMAFLSIPMLAGVLIAAVSFYKFLIYPVFLSPLSKIPNAHPTSPISPVWILWIRYTGWSNRTIQAAHEKHGPIVQVAPNEISINCVDDGIRTVYAGSFEKHQWYPNLFGAYGYVRKPRCQSSELMDAVS
jgi:hypothetical protein